MKTSLPKSFSGKFSLSKDQVNTLKFHQSKIFEDVFKWLDKDFHTTNHDQNNPNWIMLGQHFDLPAIVGSINIV